MSAKKLRVVAALCGIGLVGATFAREVSAAAPFKPGDEVVAVVPGAPLMRGNSALATVAQGQALRVLKVEGAWVGTAVMVNGKQVGGWIASNQLVTPTQYQASRQTVSRSYSYAPAPVYQGYYAAPTNSQPFVMRVTPYGAPYWRADRKIIGY